MQGSVLRVEEQYNADFTTYTGANRPPVAWIQVTHPQEDGGDIFHRVGHRDVTDITWGATPGPACLLPTLMVWKGEALHAEVLYHNCMAVEFMPTGEHFVNGIRTTVYKCDHCHDGDILPDDHVKEACPKCATLCIPF